jgi:hypothetical protein
MENAEWERDSRSEAETVRRGDQTALRQTGDEWREKGTREEKGEL